MFCALSVCLHSLHFNHPSISFFIYLHPSSSSRAALFYSLISLLTVAFLSVEEQGQWWTEVRHEVYRVQLTDEDIKSCLSLLPCHKGSLQRVALHGWYGRVFTPDALTNTIPKGICVAGWNLTSNFSLAKQMCQPNNIPLEAPSDYRHIIWEIWLSKSPKLQSVREYFEKSLIIFYLDLSGNLGSWCGR